MKNSDILNIASQLVNNDRNDQHGDMTTNHINIAKLWSAYKGVEFTAHEVAVMMALLKIARTKIGKVNPDDYVDACGYLGIAGEIASE
ncbi:DUF6378 domain-containing protein [Alphaproteobacteria bacterium]|jgi:hypothetical protein|nr:DUF6378 domain-containing protein [Alphaproteobacteria bacterium]